MHCDNKGKAFNTEMHIWQQGNDGSFILIVVLAAQYKYASIIIIIIIIIIKAENKSMVAEVDAAAEETAECVTDLKSKEPASGRYEKNRTIEKTCT